MYEPLETEQAIKMINEEELGILALNGMGLGLAHIHNIPECSVGGEQAIQYLIDTYLQDINSTNFLGWIQRGENDGVPLILEQHDFKQYFKEINDFTDSLQDMVNSIEILYGQKWEIFGYEDYDIFLATPSYNKNYNKVDIIEIHKAMSVFCTLFNNWDEDRKSVV